MGQQQSVHEGQGQYESNNNNNTKTPNEKFLESIPPQHRIPRVSKITPKEFEEKYYKPNKPVIITDMTDDWPALLKWTPSYLKEKIGEKKHTFNYTDFVDPHAPRHSIEMTVSEYIDKAVAYIESNGTVNGFPTLPINSEKFPYIRHFGPLDSTPLAKDVKLRETLFVDPKKVYERCFLFMGIPQTKTDPHYDTTANFVMMAYGTKHITLLPPGAEQHMNISDAEKRLLVRSDVLPITDPPLLLLNSTDGAITHESILMHQHPVFENDNLKNQLFYSPLHKGEIAFLPREWYHYIHNVDYSVSVTVQTALL